MIHAWLFSQGRPSQSREELMLSQVNWHSDSFPWWHCLPAETQTFARLKCQHAVTILPRLAVSFLFVLLLSSWTARHSLTLFFSVMTLFVALSEFTDNWHSVLTYDVWNERFDVPRLCDRQSGNRSMKEKEREHTREDKRRQGFWQAQKLWNKEKHDNVSGTKCSFN